MNILRKIIFLLCVSINPMILGVYHPIGMRMSELESTILDAQACAEFDKRLGLHSATLTLAQAQQLHSEGFDIHELRQADYTFLEQKTPLHVACSNRTEDGPLIVQFLVEEGADVNARSSLGTTPLFASLSSTYENCFQNISFLVARGAYVNVLCRIGDTIQTPLDNLQESVCLFQNQKDTEKILRERGAVSKSWDRRSCKIDDAIYAARKFLLRQSNDSKGDLLTFRKAYNDSDEVDFGGLAATLEFIKKKRALMVASSTLE